MVSYFDVSIKWIFLWKQRIKEAVGRTETIETAGKRRDAAKLFREEGRSVKSFTFY